MGNETQDRLQKAIEALNRLIGAEAKSAIRVALWAEAPATLEMLVEMLLLGWVDQTGDHQYFKPNSPQERAAQYALAHLLRHAEPLGRYIRNRAADLFDPSSVYARNIAFGFRREGNPGMRIKHRQIARYMLRVVRGGNTVKIAIEAAIAEYGLSERHLREIWAQYGKPWRGD